MTSSARHLRRLVATLSLACAAAVAAGCSGGSGSAPTAAPPAALDPATTGSVTGTVRLDGTPPAEQMVRMDGDRTCAKIVPGAQRATERYVVGDGGTLANVFVYVKTGLEGRSFPVPDAPVVLDQQQCWYTPRVVGVRVGQPFQVLNSDPLLHNVRAASLVNEPFNQGQPVQGVRYSHTFSTEEVMVPVKCDVHAWMNAWIGVVNHPYFAITGTDGAFTLPNLPAGTYGVEAWHEAAGTITGTATVTPQGTASLALRFKVPLGVSTHVDHAPDTSGSLAARSGAAARTRTAWSDYLALTKPRLNLLVVLTTLAGYYLGMDDASTLLMLVHTVVGTTLVAGGASVLNQLWEKDTDRLMRRTRNRPLPDARLAPRPALWFGLALVAIGLAQLWIFANPLSAGVAFVTVLSYVLVYTPLKLVSSLSTIVGAVPGALPPLIGWAAATGTLSLGGWVLFGIVFLWQMPHFLAIAWMHRDDYANAGMPLLPVIEPDGRSTGRQAVLYAAATIPVSLLPTLIGLAGPRYLAAAAVLGAIVLWLAFEFAATRTQAAARRLFFATIIYLPLLWGALVADHAARL